MKIGSKGQIPEQIPVNFILLLAMFAVGAAVLLLMAGKWLDITGYKYKMETQRNAMNLLQLIVSNSPIVKRDLSNEPIKLVLDAHELDDYQNRAGIGTESPSDERKKWEMCCDFLDFDYNFTVHNLETKENRTIGNLIFNPLSDCYPLRVIGFADIPIVIDVDGRNHPAVATIEMTRTPLSELSFWLSQAFVRASWDVYWDVYQGSEKEYHITMPLDPDIKCVTLVDDDGDGEADCIDNYGRVCVHVDKDRNGVVDITTCKNFVCDSSVMFDPDGDHTTTGDCFDVLIKVEKNYVEIFYPGDCS